MIANLPQPLEATPPPTPQSSQSPQTPPSIETQPQIKSDAATGSPESVQGAFEFFDKIPGEEKAKLAQSIGVNLARLQADLHRLLTGEYTPRDDTKWHSDCDELQPSDVLITFDVRAYNGAGEFLKVNGKQIMANVVDPSLLPEAPRNLETSLYANLFRPVTAGMMRYFNQHVDNTNEPLPSGTKPLLGVTNNVSRNIPNPDRPPGRLTGFPS